MCVCVCVFKLMKQNFYKYLCISAIFLAPIHFKILIMLLKQPKKYQKTPLLKLDFRSPGFWEGLFSRTKKEIWSTRRGILLLHQLENINPLTNQECKWSVITAFVATPSEKDLCRFLKTVISWQNEKNHKLWKSTHTPFLHTTTPHAYPQNTQLHTVTSITAYEE